MADEQRGAGYGLGLSTRTQMTGYQFLARRTAMALTRWQVRMEVEPGRRQALALVASVSAALAVCLGALMWSFISPSGQLNESPIIADRDSGALYVRVGDTIYPALNLASARLIAGRPENPHKVRSAQIAEQPHGALVGIPGAPSQILPTHPSTSSWLICDTIGNVQGVGVQSPVTVTVIDGTPDLSSRRRVLDGPDAVVLRYGDDSWVIRQGRRSRIDAADRAVLLPLGLTPEQVDHARPMSQALFDALPVGPELVIPQVPEAGHPPAFPGAPGPVGTVFTTPQLAGPQQYSVVLMNGVQTVSPVVARILQNAGATAGGAPAVVGPPELAKMPVVTGMDLSAYPDGPLKLVNIKENPATCWWWERSEGDSRARIQVVSGPTIPVPEAQMGRVVSLVKTGGNNMPEADRVYFGPNYGNFVAVTGNDPDASTRESLWWLSASGVRFGIPGDDERKALGLVGEPALAPAVALRLLAHGPTLSRQDALVRHDTLPTDMKPGELAVPK